MPTDKFIAALGKAVAARWGELPVEVQQTLLEAAIESVGEDSRGEAGSLPACEASLDNAQRQAARTRGPRAR
jgi:hypothetical protein